MSTRVGAALSADRRRPARSYGNVGPFAVPQKHTRELPSTPCAAAQSGWMAGWGLICPALSFVHCSHLGTTTSLKAVQTIDTMLVPLSLVLQLQAAPSLQPRLSGVTTSSNAITEAAESAVLRFLSTWRTAWLESVGREGYAPNDVRLRDDHCHWDGSYDPRGDKTYLKVPTLIHNGSRRSMCPNWMPAGEPLSSDERVTRDASLTNRWRAIARGARAVLIDSLAKLAKLKPGDPWITGEQVRFLVDQGNVSEALRVARGCTANQVWCAQLTGFALDAAGDYARADSAFDAASAAMTPEKRCAWTSARLLLDRRDRSAYDHLTCDQRAAVNVNLWWLSTPMFSDAGNDRRSADFSRKVLVQLHSALPWDERFDWRNQFGGEALSEMLARYGWPAFAAFGGKFEEESHAGWMGFYDSTRTATAEYPQDRIHAVPAWRAIQDPLHATADAWQLNMPPLTGDEEPAVQWWPAEHYARAAGPIRQVSDQTAMLRRDGSVLLATASELHGSAIRLGSDDTSVVLIRTTGPNDIERLPHTTYRNDQAVVVLAPIPAQPAIVGAELRAAKPGELSARTRFAVAPPPPLGELKPGERVISEPILIAATDGPVPGPENALHYMLGSTRVRGAKLGLYWETYGWTERDSVDVAVLIARREPLSKIRRLGMLMRVAHDINGSVAVRWSEPQPGHSAWTIPSSVPIQARSVRLDLSRLEPGHYAVTVLVNQHGSTVAPVSASREFVFEGLGTKLDAAGLTAP